MAISTTTASGHTAPGQALGYSLQFTRLTALLLEAPEGSFCSLEVLDDVAVTTAEATHLTQSKSALGDNPVANRALPLWKSLAIWTDQVGSGSSDPQCTTYELYISRPVSGEIVDALSKAETEAEAKIALALAEKRLSEGDPLPAQVKAFVDRVLGTSEPELLSFIQRFKLVCGSGSPQSDIEEIMRPHPISRSRIPYIADHMCGWVKRKVDMLLEQGKPAILSRDEFHDAYTSFCRKVDREALLPSLTPKPSASEAQSLIPQARTFIRQLQIIELSFEDQLSAASDYLRASADRTAWARSGDVDEESFVELEDNLKRTWSNERNKCQILHSERSEVDRGRLLYFECMAHSVAVQAMETPPHFVPGCFHGLADDKVVGWHPSYEGRLLAGDQT